MTESGLRACEKRLRVASHSAKRTLEGGAGGRYGQIFRGDAAASWDLFVHVELFFRSFFCSFFVLFFCSFWGRFGVPFWDVFGGKIGSKCVDVIL